MTDTGQVPGEGLPENAGMVEQPGVLAPGAYTYLDHSDTPADDDDLLLMPGQQGAWGNEMPQPAPFPPEPGPHEASGRDSGSIDVGAVRTPPPAPAPQPAPQRRPLHLGPPTPDVSSGLVRSLADRGPADAPMRPSGPPTTGPEYLDVSRFGENSPQGAVPWGASPQTQTVPPVAPEATAEETVVPAVAPELFPAPAAPEAVSAVAEGSGTLHGLGSPAGSHAFEVPGTPVGHEPQDIAGAPRDTRRGAAAPSSVHQVPDTPHGVPMPGAGHTGDGTPAHGIPHIGEAAPRGPMAPVVPQAAQEPVPAANFVPDAHLPDAAHFAPLTDHVLPTDSTPHAGTPTSVSDTGALQPPAGAHTPASGVMVPPADVTGHVRATAAQHTPAPASVPDQAETRSGLPDAGAQFAPSGPHGAEEPQPAFAEPVGAVPVGVSAYAVSPRAVAVQAYGEQSPGEQAHGEQTHSEQHAGAEPAGEPSAASDFGADHSLGQFVPVDGIVPTTPHLAPTPPHGLSVPPLPGQEEQAAEDPVPAAAEQEEPAVAPAAEEPVPTVPAPREGEPAAPEPLAADPGSVAAQQAEDLDTRAAEQEESTAAVGDVRESTGPAAPGYDDAEREAVLRVMRERRDIRNGFRSDPIPHEVLLRVLEAAHTAPSVGHSQPWDFVVIRSAETRRTMHELAQRQREAYAKSLPKGRAKQFKELKIEAILDTPVNIVVTADPTRGGRHTLGRHTQPQMAPYSSALAVENLWLAARAEGLGVGWVSFFDEREMVRVLGLPDHLEVVAYLCVGYVDEFPEEPELMQAGWSKRRPLSWVVHEETYGRRALPGEEPHDLLAETVAGIRPLDAKALGEAWERQKRMTKPAGALGMLEIISAQLSGLSRQCPPPIPEPAAVAIFAGDHGVHAQGVTPWPQEVTGQMVANFLGGGAVCNAFAHQVGAEVCIVDVGVASDLPATPGLLPRKVRAGTADMTTGPALSREEVKQAIEVGIETARDLVAAGNKALLTGEMGIANTTASAALISVFTDTDPSEVTGRGTGINDETLARKTEVVRRAIELHQPDPADPIGVLAAFGGLEHAAMVGLLLGGASLRTPVILDGVSAGAAALVARAIAPEVLAACIAGHRSAEPGHVAALNKLGLRPLVDLDLRLGEGTGALLALPLVQSSARAMHEVATFDSAGVTEK
ncbi:nicotinate-nucleotide--dimethylbenzimidazole phosphoribosyltransferase [Streptomyces chiangmaiensis]|uniref:Nicotinate-nucleotide--dimethylbenzimidazole phosphoribosyltransferase n=1 Tax=Streptomyces chiangmaiensis TaxID=766497 RepID=A0ABU7FRB3_9ACTN|nr:nicotinate-nucleotide--dimethylbenzimidazole phosphoribosyltransferase [Streptomyces chiangmaiensis]MED7826661.1 nicotinate-nucleotide--dimethylbenzimidazole phosphoribosyltransferase [Streptomyces chiangmaiensis]